MAKTAPILSGPAVVVILLRALLCAAYDVERTTSLGRVGGRKIEILGTSVEEYRGIPYAEPPVGELRFKAPVPAKAWQGTLDATSRRTGCPQPVGVEPITGDIDYGEDCLHLNVWVREGSSNAPVLIWMYGGAFTFSSASADNYTGAIIAADRGVVVASMNFRGGVLGFLNANSPESPGNMGFLDQNLALKWLKRNIEHFGGDPSLIALFGQSSGGMSVHAHVLSPMSRGLFQRAVAISGVINAPDLTETARESMAKGDAVAAIVGCQLANKTLASHPEEVIGCLRTRPADEIVAASFQAVPTRHIPFLPTYHDAFLPENPSEAIRLGHFEAGIDLLTGVTSDESSVMLAWKEPRPEILADNLDNVDKETLKSALYEALSLWLKDVPPTLLVDDGPGEAASNVEIRRKAVDYLQNRIFVCPMHSAAAAHASRGSRVYTYVFDHWPAKKARPSWAGVGHGTDLPYIFGMPLLDRDQINYNSEDVVVTERQLRMIGSFAGPSGYPGRPDWPRYTARSPVSMLLKIRNTTVINGFHLQQCPVQGSHL